jgi:hypothetical protein
MPLCMSITATCLAVAWHSLEYSNGVWMSGTDKAVKDLRNVTLTHSLTRTHTRARSRKHIRAHTHTHTHTHTQNKYVHRNTHFILVIKPRSLKVYKKITYKIMYYNCQKNVKHQQCPKNIFTLHHEH